MDKVDVLLGEAPVLPHEVGEGEVSVGCLTLRQEDCIVEAQILSARQFLVLFEYVVEPVGNVQFRLENSTAVTTASTAQP